MGNLYRQEVMELTELFNEEWEDLQKVLTGKGFKLSQIVLASFMEDEEENEYGIFVDRNLKVYEYVRSTAAGKNNAANCTVTDITQDSHKMEDYPQILVAVEMIKSGEI